MQQGKRVFRGGLLVLAGHKPSVDDDAGIVGSDSFVKRTSFFEHRLRVVRNYEAAAEHRLELLIAFQRVSGHTAAANPVGDIAESDSAMADGSNDFVARPEILQSLRHVLIRKQIESRATAAGDVDRVVVAQIDVF